MFNPVYHKERTREADLYSEKDERGHAANTVSLHFEKLTKILDNAILEGDKRTAFAVLSILFKVFKRPSLSLIHSGLTMLWGRKDVGMFLRSVVDLALNDKHGTHAYRHSVVLMNCAYFLSGKNYNLVKESCESNFFHNDLFNKCPLLYSFYGQVCVILLNEADDEADKRELINEAIRTLTHALNIAKWINMDETAYILAFCYFLKNNIEESKRVLTKYARFGPKNICALRMKAEFLMKYGTNDDEKSLLCSYIDWVAEDPSSETAYDQLFKLILKKSGKVAIGPSVTDKLSRVALSRITNCQPQDWTPWAYLTMLLRQGVEIEPVWGQKTWASIHLSPFGDVDESEIDGDYILAKAAFCEAVYGMEDKLTQWWVSILKCPKKFKSIDDYARYYEKKEMSVVYRIISFDLKGIFEQTEDDGDGLEASQSISLPVKRIKLEKFK